MKKSRRKNLSKKDYRKFSLAKIKTVSSIVFGIVVGIIGIIGWIEGHFHGSVLPEKPEISAQNISSTSTDVLPFMITDENLIFKIRKVEPRCFIDLLYFMDADRKTGIFRDAVFSEGATAIDASMNYECDTKFVHVNPDGAFEIGLHGGQSLVTGASTFRPPITILKMCVQIDGKYERFDGTHSFKSVMFQWPAKPNINQWIKGPIAFDIDQSIWIPEHSRVVWAWGLRRLVAENNIDLVPDALRCDWEPHKQK